MPNPKKSKKPAKEQPRKKAMPGSLAFTGVFSELFLAFMESFKEEYGDTLNSTVSVAALIQNFETNDPAMVAGGSTRQLFDLGAHIVCFVTKELVDQSKSGGRNAYELAPIIAKDMGVKAQMLFAQASSFPTPSSDGHNAAAGEPGKK